MTIQTVCENCGRQVVLEQKDSLTPAAQCECGIYIYASWHMGAGNNYQYGYLNDVLNNNEDIST